MNIYVEVKGNPNLGMNYESDIVPRVGDTISISRASKRWRVLSVDHLLNESPFANEAERMRLEIVTIIVELALRE